MEAYRITQGIPVALKLPPMLNTNEILARQGPAPTKPGVYFLIRRGKIMYVGQSINPLCRLGQHAAERDFDNFVVVPCEREQLTPIEGNYILKFRPPWNKNGL